MHQVCLKIEKTATEKYQLLQQAYGEDAMGRTQVFDWFRRFKEGRTSVVSDPHSGQPSTSRNKEMITKVRTIIRNNRRLTVREIADDCDVCMNQFAENDRKNGGMATISCTTTMRPAHTSHFVQQVLARNVTAQLQQPPYSPDPASYDFFLFPRLKKVLKGHRFESMEDIKLNSMKTLLDIPKMEFAKCFQQWQQCWAKCVAAEGNNVEDSYG